MNYEFYFKHYIQRMKQYLVILLALFCAQVTLCAHNNHTDAPLSIQGKVVDKQSNTPISFATIQILGSKGGEVVDADGNYTFTNLPTGKYKLRVQALGYKTINREVNVKGGTTTSLDFVMEEDALMIDEVVVSANRNEVSRRNAPVVVNVMNTKLFETVNSTDLAKSLSYQSGLRVENNCQNCGFPQVRINGLEGPYSQILINSRPVISALSGVYGLEQIPVNMIERVEVVRGGGSALFGANAVGGTINIITKDPVSNSFQVSSTISAMNGKSWEQFVGANASYVSSDNSYGIALYESYRNRNPYDADGDGYSELGKLNMNSFGMRGYYRPSVLSRLTLEYHTTNEFRRGGNKFDMQPHQTDITEQTKHIINSGGVSYDQFWNDYQHKLSVYGSIQHTDRKSYYGTNYDENAYGKTYDLTWVTGAMYVGNFDRFLIGKSTVTSGLEYQDNDLHDVMLGYNRDLKQRVHIAGAFLQNEWEWDYFNLLVGGRLDKHNIVKHLIFSPRVNLLYKPFENFQTRATFSTGFRAPQAYDEDLHVAAVGGEGIEIRLSDNLREEKSTSYSASMDWTTNIGHWQANILLEGFYTELRHVFVLEDLKEEVVGDGASKDITYKERRNGSKARVAGVNVDAKLAHGKDVQLQVGFTAQNSQYSKYETWTTTDDGVALKTKKMPRTPNLYGYFTLTTQPFKSFEWSLSGIYTGKMNVPHMAGVIETPRMERSPNFYELGTKLSYTFNMKNNLKLQLNGGVQNVFNAFQKDLDKGKDRDSNYFYGPTQPRTYFVGLKISNL